MGFHGFAELHLAAVAVVQSFLGENEPEGMQEGSPKKCARVECGFVCAGHGTSKPDTAGQEKCIECLALALPREACRCWESLGLPGLFSKTTLGWSCTYEGTRAFSSFVSA